METGNTASVTTAREDDTLFSQEPVQLTETENRQADEGFERELSNPSALLDRARVAIQRRSPNLSADKKELIARTAVTDLLAAVAKATREATTLTSDNTPDTTL